MEELKINNYINNIDQFPNIITWLQNQVKNDSSYIKSFIGEVNYNNLIITYKY